MENKPKLKVVISDRIYIKPDKALLERMGKNLTYEMEATYNQRETQYAFNYGPILRGTYWMPMERLDLLQGYELEIIDKRILVPVSWDKPSFTLRPDQQAILDAIDDTSIINGAPGFGKTICAIAVAHKLQQKTLVVTTTTGIRDMWVKEIEAYCGFTPGIIGSGKFNLDAPIVVGNIQTLTRRTALLEKEFGLLIFDEVHHCPASTFAKVLLGSKARYRLGLSGTLIRKDGMHSMFKDFFGFNVITPAIANTVPPTIHTYASGVTFPGTGAVPWANRVTELTMTEMYRKEVLILMELYASIGHKVIVISDRTEFLEYLVENTKTKSALFTGALSLEDREATLQKMTDGGLETICATQSLFSEGISQNNLSCMILGAPISDNISLIHQLAGRIMRIDKGKLDPILVDIKLVGSSARGQYYKRKSIYQTAGWKVEDITLQQLINQRDQMPALEEK